MFVYIMTNKNHTVLYVGVTNDIERRANEHKYHFDTDSFTAKYNVEQVVYLEEIADTFAALEREKQLKRWSRAKKINLIEKQNPNRENYNR